MRGHEGIGGNADHLDIGIGLEDPLQRLADAGGIINDQNADLSPRQSPVQDLRNTVLAQLASTGRSAPASASGMADEADSRRASGSRTAVRRHGGLRRLVEIDQHVAAEDDVHRLADPDSLRSIRFRRAKPTSRTQAGRDTDLAARSGRARPITYFWRSTGGTGSTISRVIDAAMGGAEHLGARCRWRGCE